MDGCAQSARGETNESVSEYWTTNFHGKVCGGAKKKTEEFMLDNPNLRLVDGFGVDSCLIAEETSMRMDSGLTQPRSRKQLNAREFQAVPDLSKGVPAPVLESRLVQGQDTFVYRNCEKFGSVDFNRYVPLINPCWHISKTTYPVPQSSKDIMRQHDTVSCAQGRRDLR